ncbi:UNVERIFIED_CONTAM: hypothetical protein GTU68_009111, partial [Idotea baltica]|nr:hypothetical protein [Idotea baltica]
TLYVVATPIGNRDDLSGRAIKTLNECHCIYAEDTRHSRPLLQYHGIDTPMRSLHEHNEAGRSDAIVAQLQTTGSVAIISDAGTPLINDPGYRIVRACQDAGITVSPIPGASALIAALSVGGLATDRFLYAGFPPAKSAARKTWLLEFAQQSCSLVLYESPHRIMASLADIVDVFGGAREICLARELTKRFETVIRASASDVLETLENDAQQQKGEFVLVIAGAPGSKTGAEETELKAMLKTLLNHMPVKTA